MKQYQLILAMAALMASVQAANAFEQTQVGSGDAAPTAPIATPATPATPDAKTRPSGLPGVELTIPSEKQADEGGTVVRLPMIGVIGRLPKLDFGLELLYGADKDKTLEEERIFPESQTNDLTIRGSVKHRF